MFYKNSFLNCILLILLCSVHEISYSADDFILNDTAGTKHTLSQYKGKWVIVNYWATWCPPCLEEVPDLVSLYDKHRNKKLMVIGVAYDYQSSQEVAQYVDDMLISYPIVLGNDSVRKQIGGSEVLPTTYIYNPQGLLIKTKFGIVTKKYLEAIISGELK
jgi:thiol-disulfide isomerase/thioredoxin